MLTVRTYGRLLGTLQPGFSEFVAFSLLAIFRACRMVSDSSIALLWMDEIHFALQKPNAQIYQLNVVSFRASLDVAISVSRERGHGRPLRAKRDRSLALFRFALGLGFLLVADRLFMGSSLDWTTPEEKKQKKKKNIGRHVGFYVGLQGSKKKPTIGLPPIL